MRSILNYKIIVFATLVIWLMASWGGAHGHMCFDGQEPPITVHIHAVGDHADHDSSEQHVDADVDLSQPLLTKFTKIDLPLLIAAAHLLAGVFEKISAFASRYSYIYVSRIAGLHPPLRAPPITPA